MRFAIWLSKQIYMKSLGEGVWFSDSNNNPSLQNFITNPANPSLLDFYFVSVQYVCCVRKRCPQLSCHYKSEDHGRLILLNVFYSFFFLCFSSISCSQCTTYIQSVTLFLNLLLQHSDRKHVDIYDLCLWNVMLVGFSFLSWQGLWIKYYNRIPCWLTLDWVCAIMIQGAWLQIFWRKC